LYLTRYLKGAKAHVIKVTILYPSLSGEERERKREGEREKKRERELHARASLSFTFGITARKNSIKRLGYHQEG